MAGEALGVIAGGGDLPRAIAESARDAGRKVFVLALRGSSEDWVSNFAHEWVSVGETGKAFKALTAGGVGDVLLAGKVERPKFSEIKLDAKSILLAPRVMAAALKGDDALLRSIVEMFEREGFRVVGAAEAAPNLIAGAGPLGRIRPSVENEGDIALAFSVVRALGQLDVGQAAAVCAGLTLSVEAAEGTDAMIARIANLPEHIRGTPARRRGVLAKAPKPVQDRKTDLPVIGVQTVRNVAAVGLAGIAVEAGGALIVDKRAVADEADKLGLFVTGVPA
jgi:UDP-2,3-diacylglucosamine hydrolase